MSKNAQTSLPRHGDRLATSLDPVAPSGGGACSWLLRDTQALTVPLLLLIIMLVLTTLLLQPATPLATWLQAQQRVQDGTVCKECPIPDTAQRAEQQYEENIRHRDFKLAQVGAGLNSVALRENWLVPTYSCAVEARVGLWGEGGKWVCLGHFGGSQPGLFSGAPVSELEENVPLGTSAALNTSSAQKPIVISIGSNGQTDFESDVASRLGAISHTFDFTLSDATKAQVRQLPFLKFYDAGVAGSDEIERLKGEHPGSTFYTVPELMQAIQSPFADVFKIDCDGCEFGVIRDLGKFYNRTTAPFGQVQIEIHFVNDGYVAAHVELFKTFESLGYRLFHVEINALYTEGFELAYIHESLVTRQ